jgi:hypothetical protein
MKTKLSFLTKLFTSLLIWCVRKQVRRLHKEAEDKDLMDITVGIYGGDNPNPYVGCDCSEYYIVDVKYEYIDNKIRLM